MTNPTEAEIVTEIDELERLTQSAALRLWQLRQRLDPPEPLTQDSPTLRVLR
jgi:hypothetical protein